MTDKKLTEIRDRTAAKYEWFAKMDEARQIAICELIDTFGAEEFDRGFTWAIHYLSIGDYKNASGAIISRAGRHSSESWRRVAEKVSEVIDCTDFDKARFTFSRAQAAYCVALREWNAACNAALAEKAAAK